MNNKKTRLIDKFQAKSESGKIVIISKRQELNIVNEFGAEPCESPGRMWFCTSDETPVNQIDENTYETLVGAEVIRFVKIR